MSEGGSPAGRSPPFWLAAGHLAALWAVAVALPVFDLLGKNPTFFVAHGAGAAEILLVCALVVAAVPAALVLVLAGFRMVSRPAADVYLAVMVGVLAALLLGSLFDSLLGPLLVPIAAVAGTVAGLGCHRGTSIRTALTVLVPVPLVLTAWFLFLTPTRTLVFPPSVSAASVTLEDEPPPIFVIVFDEMPVASLLDRDLAIDAERYPNLARLAGDGTFYRNATGVGAFSNEAIPAILTGKLVTESGIPPTAGGHPENLFTLLASAYRVVATEPVTGLCSDSICEKSPSGPRDLPIDVLLTDLAVVAGHSALPEVLVDALPSLEGSWSYFGRSRPAPERFAGEEPRTEGAPEFADPSAVAIGQWDLDIAEIDVADEPTLRFIHTVFPHFPWNRHADGRAFLSLDAHGLLFGVWTSEYGSDIGLQRHLLQTQYADQLFGEFLERLDALGLYDDSLIVVTSDHGASFDRSLRVPEGATDEAGVMGVPLLVLAAGALFVGGGFAHLFIGADQVSFWRGSIVLAKHVDHDMPFWLTISPTIAMTMGFLIAWYCYMWQPLLPFGLAKMFPATRNFFLHAWYFDALYDFLFVRPANRIGRFLWKFGDGTIIDGIGPNGIAARVLDITNRVVKLQTGYIYHYAFIMLIGVALFITYFIFTGGGLMP